MKNVNFLKVFLILFSMSISAFAQTPTKGKISLEDMMNFGKNKVDVSSIPDKYSFSWKYTMQITTDKNKDFETDYFLQPNSGYYGASVNPDKKKSQMFMIMDAKKKIMITTFGDESKKMAMASNMPDYAKIAEAKGGKLTYKAVPGKEILGYQCKGMQASNEEMTVIFYYTTQAKVSFAEMFQSGKSGGMPDVFKGFFKPNEKPLTLEVIYNDLKKDKTTTMKCIALEPNSFTFNKSDYKFM